MSSWGSESDFNGSVFSPASYEISPENISKPARWPLLLQSLGIVLSVAIYLVSPRNSFLLMSAIAYTICPFFVFALLAVQRAQDLNARSDAFYDQPMGKKYLRISSYLGISSFVISIPIILRLATEISQR
jgi:hypothetical protein